MADATTPLFAFSVSHDGSFSGTVPPAVVASAGAVNWIQVIQTLLPLILQILALFGGGTVPPTPAPSPLPTPVK